jgi:hypothetical protein|tara:strand:+ start:117 stop:323 length:207 start_codon:yes stop_codon:yes gene_type:complete
MKDYILRKYGTRKNCANSLGVDVRTVYRWININAMPMLKHADKIVQTSDTTRVELIGEILFNEEEKQI